MHKTFVFSLLVLILILGAINFAHREAFQEHVLLSHGEQEKALRVELKKGVADRFTGQEGKALLAEVLHNKDEIEAIKNKLLIEHNLAADRDGELLQKIEAIKKKVSKVSNDTSKD